MDCQNIIAILLIVILAIYICLKRCYTYWKRKGLDYLEPYFFYGNVKKMAKGKLAFGEQFKELYLKLKAKGIKQQGGIYVFFNPVYIPLDPQIVKCILQKDFDHFRNHGIYVNEEADPLTGHLFNLEDARWKIIRTKLTPTFTSGKMKLMFPTLAACTKGLEEVLNVVIKGPVDIRDVLSRFTIDIISSCAFGLECNSLKNPNTNFRKYGTMIFDGSFSNRIKFMLTMVIPTQLLRKMRFKFFSREIESFFMNLVKDTIEYREKHNVYRKDFIQLLLQLKDGSDSNKERKSSETDQGFLTMDEITAQCFGFFTAGFETSAATMTFALYEMALNQEIQDELRKEIVSVLARYDDEISYDAIMEMRYLEKVISETLRKYPPAPATQRICNTTYTVPGTGFVIDKGTTVQIPIMGIHHDPEYYSNPNLFDPERFSEENKSERPAFTYLPFGEGPRICIGARFGLMQVKVGLISVIQRFRITVNKRTENPIKLDNQSFILGVKKGIWLNVAKVEDARNIKKTK